MDREKILKKLAEDSIKAREKVLEKRKPKFQRFDSPPLPHEVSYGGAVSSGGGITPIEPEVWEDKYSFYFDGLVGNSFIAADDESIYDLTDAITISVWCKPTDQDPLQMGYMVDKYTGAGGFNIRQSTAGAGSWSFQINTVVAASETLTVPNNIAADIWQHILCTYDIATGDMLIYVNSVLEGTRAVGPADPMKTNGVDLILGASSSTPTGEFKGNLDEISIWSHAFSQDEINEIYHGGKPNDLTLHSKIGVGVGWYRMGDEASWSGATWEMNNEFNVGTGDATSSGLLQTARQKDTP